MLKPCTTPGCPNRCPNGRCEGCRARRNRTTNQRRDGWRTLYGGDWPRIRLDYLTRNPACALCGHLAAVADHHPRGIRLLLKHQVANPHADRYLRPLCKACHDTATARKEPGGWHRSGRL